MTTPAATTKVSFSFEWDNRLDQVDKTRWCELTINDVSYSAAILDDFRKPITAELQEVKRRVDGFPELVWALDDVDETLSDTLNDGGSLTRGELATLLNRVRIALRLARPTENKAE
jgi:hypothetical protein